MLKGLRSETCNFNTSSNKNVKLEHALIMPYHHHLCTLKLLLVIDFKTKRRDEDQDHFDGFGFVRNNKMKLPQFMQKDYNT